jgi:hypothetical protein
VGIHIEKFCAMPSSKKKYCAAGQRKQSNATGNRNWYDGARSECSS